MSERVLSPLRHQTSLSSTLLPPLPSQEEDVIIADDELDLLNEKHQKAHSLYQECLRSNVMASTNMASNPVKITSRSNLYDLDPGLQAKIRDVIMRKLQKNSFMKELELYPVTVHDNIQRKLGIDPSSTDEFNEKICKYFKKQADIVKEQQCFLFKKGLSFHSEYHNHQSIAQLQQSMDIYDKKLTSRRARYLDLCYKLSKGAIGEPKEPLQVSMQQGNKLIFTNKLTQPPFHKPSKVIDYKLYLNDKVRKYKLTRDLRKFQEIVKSFPVSLMPHFYPNKTTPVNSVSEIEEAHQDGKDKTGEYRNIKDFETVKNKLRELCQSFDINNDINVDNGAYLLFRVDVFFKDTYAKQQERLNFLLGDENRPLKLDKTFSRPEAGGPEQSRVSMEDRARYLKRAWWLEKFPDFEEIDNQRKLKDATYGGRFDSLLKSWFEFVQISDVKESITKLEFRLNRLKDHFEEKKAFHQEVFYEFMRGYMKLSVIKARNYILKIYDSLNFFRSVEKTIYEKKQALHDILAPSRKGETSAKESSTGEFGTLESLDLLQKDNNPFLVKIGGQLQEDRVVFREDGIDIFGTNKQVVMYDVVQKDFEKVTSEMLQVGAHYIDTNREKKTKKGNFNVVLDDIDRETLLVGLLDYEAQYQFAKARYVKDLLEILHNTFTFRHSMDVMKYMQETIPKRPKFELFDESLHLSYNEEIKYYEQLGTLATSLISSQKSQENRLDEFQEHIFTQEEMINLQKTVIPANNNGQQPPATPPEDITFHKSVMDKEFEDLKPYESLIWVFYSLVQVEKAVDNSIKNLGDEEKGLSRTFKVQRLALEEAYTVWEHIRYNLTLVSSVKEYEMLHCDVLLDMPDSSYDLLKARDTPSMARESSQRSQMTPKSHQTGAGSGAGNTARKNEVKEGIGEEEYLRNMIEFVRMKENLLVSLMSSGYQAEIYLYQVKMFGEEEMYKDIVDKPGDFQRHFMNLLLNLEAVNLTLDLKDLGDCKVIVLNPSKMGDLRVIVEFLVLHEVLLQNALYMNFCYMQDVLQFYKGDMAKFYEALKSPHSKNMFFNIPRRKNTWFIHANINPMVFAGSSHGVGKLERIKSVEKFKDKTESIRDATRHIQRYVYHDSLRIQTIEISRMLRRLILRLGFDDKGIFKLTDLFIEKKASKLVKDLSNVGEEEDEASDNETDLQAKSRNVHARLLEDYFDTSGKWLDPFVLPATQDIIYADLEKHYQKIPEPTPDTMKSGRKKEHISMVQKVTQALEEEILAKKSRRKKIKRNTWVENRPQLDFLKNCRMIFMLEYNHYLLQILTYELFEGTMPGNPFDFAVFYEGTSKEHILYRRNELRISEGLGSSQHRLKRLRDYVGQVIRGLKPGDTKEGARGLLKAMTKNQYQLALLAGMQGLEEARKLEDVESLKIIRRFMIRMAFNTHNYVYKYGERLCFNDYFCKQQKRKDNFMKEIGFQDAETIKLIDFLFMEPVLKKNRGETLCFLDYAGEYGQDHKAVLMDLFLLKKDWKVMIATRMGEMRFLMEDLMTSKDILPADSMVQYLREANKLLKRNMKSVLMREAILCLQTKALPFSDVHQHFVTDSQRNIQHHYNQAIADHEKDKKIISKKKKEVPVVEDHIEKFIPDFDKVSVLKNVLTAELEKLILKEGTECYMNNIVKLQKASRLKASSLRKAVSGETDKDRIIRDVGQHRFLPFLYGFTAKMLNRALFIEAHNIGECVVIPVNELEDGLHELNKGILGYFDEVDYEIQKKYAGKISVLQSQLDGMSKDFERMRRQIDIAQKDQERTVEARLAEEGTKVLFQVDMLKKKINYMQEEQDFLVKDAKEKVRQEFKDKIAEDEVAKAQIKKRFHEYKEGMAIDLRRFIESEKNQTLRSIIEKKNQVFLTSQGESPGRADNRTLEEKILEDLRQPEDEYVVKKLYDLLKKTRVMYYFKEVVLKEKCEREINEMKKKLVGNHNLLNKLSDLQNNEASLKDNLTDAKKELAIMERRNKVLSKALQRDSNEKIRLHREQNTSKQESSEVQDMYKDALKRKAIFISTDDPMAGNLQKGRYYIKAHMDVLSGIKTEGSVERSPGLLDEINELTKMKSDKKRETIGGRVSLRQMRPMTGTSSSKGLRSPLNATAHVEGDQKLGRISSYLDLSSPTQSRSFVAEVKSAGKGKKDSKGFLVKKYVQKDGNM